jgi:predicted dehydrogenase/8-oxo-dGTP pyrophosphatase MutT (NUDIX family)
MSLNTFSSIPTSKSTLLNHEEITYAGWVLLTDTGKIVCIEQKRWIDIVGGHRDPGEAPLETLLRETYEEIGFTIVPHTHAPVIVSIREGSEWYRWVENPKMVYYAVNAWSEEAVLAGFSQRTHRDEASKMVFLSPAEFMTRYSAKRGDTPFVENMRVAVEAALDARWKKLTVWLSALGDHQIRWHLFPLEVDTRVGDILVFDPDRQKAISKLREHGVDFESSPWKIRSIDTTFESIVDNPYITAAFISSPDQFHIAQTRDLLRAGKHVFCEKPLLHTTSEVSELVNNILLAREKWLILSSCHPRRFDRPFLWLKEYLSQSNPLGKIRKVDFTFSYPVPEEGKEWLHTGLIADHFNHEIDLVNFYLWWDDFIAQKISDTQTEYAVRGTRADGVKFEFSGKRDRPRGSKYAEWMVLTGENWSIQVDTESWFATLFRDSEERILAEGLEPDYVGRFQATTSNFIDAIVAGGRSYLTPRDLLLNNLSGAVLTQDGYFDSADYTTLFDIIKSYYWK